MIFEKLRYNKFSDKYTRVVSAAGDSSCKRAVEKHQQQVILIVREAYRD